MRDSMIKAVSFLWCKIVNSDCLFCITLCKMITLRLYNALRLSSNFNIQRTVQFCGFKSRYNIENLYPNTASDLSPKVRLS